MDNHEHRGMDPDCLDVIDTTGDTVPHCHIWSGVDVVAIGRINRLYVEFGDSFTQRVYTPTEIAYCESRPHPSQHYAARWAAKEAFRKAVDTDGPHAPFSSIGITRTESGPSLTLDAPAKRALEYTIHRRGSSRESIVSTVSLSHDRPAGVAMAHVIIVGSSKSIEHSDRTHTDR